MAALSALPVADVDHVERVLRGGMPGQYAIYRTEEELDLQTDQFRGVCVSFQGEVSRGRAAAWTARVWVWG